jgi:outer membrane protein insertion porin family
MRLSAVGRRYAVAGLLLLGAGERLAAQGDDGDVVVRGLSFQGNEMISEEALRASIATTQSSFVARFPLTSWLGIGERYFNETEFRRDVIRLQLLYRQSGFVEATIDTLVRRSDDGVQIQFRIYEGRPIRVTSLEVTGIQGLLDTARLRRELPLQVGDPFNRLLLQASADTIKARLADRGHPRAEVFRNFDEDRVNRTARISLDVDPGPLVRVDGIEVRSLNTLDERFVRRRLTVRPGDRYSESAIRESQLDLYRTDLFNYVNITPADSAPAPNDSTVTLQVEVSEAPLRRVRLGVGFGTIDCFRAQNAWTVHNFMGGGRRLRLDGRLSQIGVGDPLDAGLQDGPCIALGDQDPTRLVLNYNASLSFTEPFFFSRRTEATIAVFAERHSEFDAFLREAYGADVSLTRHVSRDLDVTLRYSLSRARTQAEPAVFCTFLNVCTPEDVTRFTDWRRRSTGGISVVRSDVNSVVDPSSGSRLSLELRHASALIGSDSLSRFTKAVGEYGSYHRVGRRSVFAWRVRVGTIIQPSELSLAGQAVEFVPPEERFYGGGPNSVRGYSQNELGPVVRVLEGIQLDTNRVDGRDSIVPDSTIRTSPTGGNDLALANVEYRFHLPGLGGRASGALFVDIGQVFIRSQRILNLGQLRVTPGFGIRVASPLGPVRLDVGYNPYDPEPSPLYSRSTLETLVPAYRPDRPGFLGRLRIHFSVGQAF